LNFREFTRLSTGVKADFDFFGSENFNRGWTLMNTNTGKEILTAKHSKHANEKGMPRM